MKIDLSTEEGYDLAAAVRGPDIRTLEASFLKELFTAFIRGHLGISSEYGWSRKEGEFPKRSLSWYNRSIEDVFSFAVNNEAMNHYIAHVLCALNHINSTESLHLRKLVSALVRMDRKDFVQAYKDLEELWQENE